MVLGLTLAGCGAGVPPVKGPARPLIRDVSRIELVDLKNAGHPAKVVSDPAKIEAFLIAEAWLFSDRWDPDRREALPPALRIDLRTTDGQTSSYWLGYWADALLSVL